MFGKKQPRLEIYVGTVGCLEPIPSLDNPELYETLVGWPVPRKADHISGRNIYGQQYGATVLWVQHYFEHNLIRVYAMQS